jgi:hypothetical protein
MPGGFSGNGSVKWWVDAGNEAKGVKSNGKGSKGWEQSGEDHWEGDDDWDFTLKVKVPKNVKARQLLENQLRAAAERVKAGQDFFFILPVEDKKRNKRDGHGDAATEHQIVVEWGSASVV